MKEFNTVGLCIPSKHYMVDLSERVTEIRKLVDAGKYFTINRARQFGKTTTLNALEVELEDKYYVVSMDFQDFGDATFSSEDWFCRDFSAYFCMHLTDKMHRENEKLKNAVESLVKQAESNNASMRLSTMFLSMRRIWDAADKPIVLLIDEVDHVTENQLFINFLAALRSQYLKRERGAYSNSFKSVILAGVTDIRFLKAKIRGSADEQENSPWNISTGFDIDMSLSEAGIRDMLNEYEADHHVGMNTAGIAKTIRKYTNGYPYLVSRICQVIDTKLVPSRFDTLADAWTEYGVDEAVKIILKENNSLFYTLMEKVNDYENFARQLRLILLRGETIAYLSDDKDQNQLIMYGLIDVDEHDNIRIANSIFEMRLYTHFIGENRYRALKQHAAENKSLFIEEDGSLNIPRIMKHFILAHNRIHSDMRKVGESEEIIEERRKKFIEEEGRERFLTYLSPVINGTGTYSIEEQTRDRRRMDVVIHYLGRRYIIELKIWHGERYNAEGEKQISEYLEHWSLNTGYMLSFNFNKHKSLGVERVHVGNKILYEGIV